MYAILASMYTLRGFTLIELLVVISIIGILASVVLVSLNSARNRGADAAIKGNISGIRTQAELTYDTSNSYATVCANATNAINAAKSAAGVSTVTTFDAIGATGVATCNDTAGGWAIQIPLKSVSTSFWCADSSSIATSTVSSTLTATSDIICG